jgi:hypothetical protein
VRVAHQRHHGAPRDFEPSHCTTDAISRLKQQTLHVDADAVDHPHRAERQRDDVRVDGGDRVAAGADKILALDDALVAPRSEPVPAAQRRRPNAVEAARRQAVAQRPIEELRAEVDLELNEDRATMAEIRSDLASVHIQLGAISAGIIGLQSHSLRQTGMVAFALAVLIAVAWKVVEG